MDPNVTLNLLRNAIIAAPLFERSGDHDKAFEVYQEAAEHFAALDEWLSKGGFPPDDWERALAQLRERLGR